MNIINSIEKIILNKDIRSISKLKNSLGDNFVSDAAERILINKGTVFISTGFTLFMLRRRKPMVLQDP